MSKHSSSLLLSVHSSANLQTAYGGDGGKILCKLPRHQQANNNLKGALALRPKKKKLGSVRRTQRPHKSQRDYAQGENVQHLMNFQKEFKNLFKTFVEQLSEMVQKEKNQKRKKFKNHNPTAVIQQLQKRAEPLPLVRWYGGPAQGYITWRPGVGKPKLRAPGGSSSSKSYSLTKKEISSVKK